MTENNYCTLYIIRHGQTDWNTEKKIQGQTDIALNQNGEAQAAELNLKLRPIHFDAAFSSDLIRAHRTAELALLERNIAIKATDQLRERKFGELEGQSLQKLFELEALLQTLSHESRKTHKPDPTFESDEEVIGRVITFLREVAVSYPEKNVLISTHGGIIRLLLIHMGLMAPEAIPKIENGCYMKVKSDGVDFIVEELNGIDFEKIYE